jgi:hypothetical protein
VIRELVDLELSQEVFSAYEHGKYRARAEGCTGPLCEKSDRDRREYVPPPYYQYRLTAAQYRDHYIAYRQSQHSASRL